MTDTVDELDLEWWEYRYKTGLVMGSMMAILSGISTVIYVAGGEFGFLLLGVTGAIFSSFPLGYALWKHQRGPQPDETPVIDLTSEQVDQIANQINEALDKKQS